MPESVRSAKLRSLAELKFAFLISVPMCLLYSPASRQVFFRRVGLSDPHSVRIMLLSGGALQAFPFRFGKFV
jgi:hypothetical protein